MNVSYLWIIPVAPLVSSALIRLFGRSVLNRRSVHILACASVFLSFLTAVRAFLELREAHEPLRNALFPWIQVGLFNVHMSFLFDSLGAVMALVVTGVGFLIHVYSTGYMGHDPEYPRYFSYLNLFTAMMLILVLGESLLLMFVGWEGVGLCSYLLIGFWFTEKANADAGKKAFVVNRIGDFGFMVGILALFWTLGMSKGIWSLDFSVLKANVDVFTSAGPIFGISLITFATLGLFVGAAGKSAQIPLYVWLPDAMAGPTPVSALIHAATMVTAGVYMVARLSFLFDLAPITLAVIAVVGALTALFSATIALAQNDIKKVLAYSTVSQLGYMFLACGVGAYSAAIFHVTTHAFFKALLFLGAGSVIHALSGEQDMRKMGGIRKKLPVTYWTFLIATLAIVGIPGLAGFFSKDEILWEAFATGHRLLWSVGWITAGLTAFYMFRLFFLTFHGESRSSEEVRHHTHESPPSMLIPLVLLATGSLTAGYLWMPGFLGAGEPFLEWLGDSVVVRHIEANHRMEIAVASVPFVLTLLALYLARKFYVVSPQIPAHLSEKWAGVHRTLLNKYWVDEFYEHVFVRGTKRLASLIFWFDSRTVDGAVNGAGWLLRVIVHAGGTVDNVVVDGLVNWVGDGTFAIGKQVRRLQTGQIQFYLGTLAGVFAAVAIVWMSWMLGS
ncbi:MAG: NADH-quinone oxidoreductase subunit L [Pseudomonadota bacterium]